MVMKATLPRVGRAKKQPDNTLYSGRLAIRIDELRTAKGMTIEQLQEAIVRTKYNVSVSGLYKWLNGDAQPQYEALPHIAKALGISIAELMPAK